MGALDGRVALVTGGATKIGRGVAEALAADGAHVVVADIDETGFEALAPGIDAEVADITDDARLAGLVAGIVERHGALDIVVNLAATYLDNGADTSREDWLTALNVNLVSTAMVVAAARPHLAASGHGAVVNVTSISSSVSRGLVWVRRAGVFVVVEATISSFRRGEWHHCWTTNIRGDDGLHLRSGFVDRSEDGGPMGFS